MRRLLALVVCLTAIELACGQAGVLHGNGDPRLVAPVPNCGQYRFYVDDSTQKLYEATIGSPCTWIDTSVDSGTYPLNGTSLGFYTVDEPTSSNLLYDYSSFHQTITLPNSGGPTRSQGALGFSGSQCVSTGIAQSATQSVVMLASFPAQSSAYNASAFGPPVFLGSTTNSGAQIGYYNGNPAFFGVTSGSLTAKPAWTLMQTPGGWHVWTITGIGTATAQFYIDGNLIGYYNQQGSYTIPSGALWQLGCFNGAGNPSWMGPVGSGTIQIGAIDFQPTTLTAAQVSAAAAWMLNIELPSKGYTALPYQVGPYDTAQSNLFCVGDSRVAGTPATSQGLCGLISAPTNGVAPWKVYTATNFGLGGTTGNFQLMNKPSYLSIKGTQNNTTAVVYWSGVNQLTTPQAECSVTQALRDLGFAVFRITEPSNTSESSRDSYNANLYTNWQACGITALVDVATIPTVGTDGASTTGSWATYFSSSGGPHMTTTGYQVVANAVTNVMNWYYAGSPSGWTSYTTNSTITTRYSLIKTSGSTLTITLPDCQGLTGMPFYFKVLATSGTSGATLTAVNSELIDGTATSSLANLASVKLLPMPNAPATGGCFWMSAAGQ